ncbi:MAG TPA: dTDP-glucose 4,6-dehydratase [Novosphingobium sp.]|nr:dTDP-glucose 4,6-dehydratase [Novosphingobium sp.]
MITGGAGFIGSALVRQLLRDTAAHVCTVDVLTYAGNLDALAEVLPSDRHSFHRADIGDAEAMAGIFAAFRPDCVMHLAAETHVDRSIDRPLDFVRANLVGTATLLEAATAHWRALAGEDRARFRFLHVSTDEVFGSAGPAGSFDEASGYDPRSPYAATKAGSDHLVRAWHHTYGLPAVITNCSNNFGPFQFPDKLIPRTIVRALRGETLQVYGDGANVRDWLYVDDHAGALRLIMDGGRDGETYCIGGSGERSNLQVVEAVCAEMDRQRPRADGQSYLTQLEFVADRPGHDFRYAVNAGKLIRELGWRPSESFESGIARTVRWNLDNEEWWRGMTEGSYRGERLGLGHA